MTEPANSSFYQLTGTDYVDPVEPTPTVSSNTNSSFYPFGVNYALIPAPGNTSGWLWYLNLP